MLQEQDKYMIKLELYGRRVDICPGVSVKWDSQLYRRADVHICQRSLDGTFKHMSHLLQKPYIVWSILITVSAWRLFQIPTCWTESTFRLRERAFWDVSCPHEQKERVSPRHFTVSWGWQKHAKKTARSGRSVGDILQSRRGNYHQIGMHFWFRTVNADVTCFGGKSSARRPWSPSLPLTVTSCSHLRGKVLRRSTYEA